MKLQAHPAAELFPMLSEIELDALAQDIKDNGQLHPKMSNYDAFIHSKAQIENDRYARKRCRCTSDMRLIDGAWVCPHRCPQVKPVMRVDHRTSRPRTLASRKDVSHG
jgi:hypothetical protein